MGPFYFNQMKKHNTKVAQVTLAPKPSPEHPPEKRRIPDRRRDREDPDVRRTFANFRADGARDAAEGRGTEGRGNPVHPQPLGRLRSLHSGPVLGSGPVGGRPFDGRDGSRPSAEPRQTQADLRRTRGGGFDRRIVENEQTAGADRGVRANFGSRTVFRVREGGWGRRGV